MTHARHSELLSVYLIYSANKSAFKIGVSVFPKQRCSDLRWSANNPWGEVIETQLCRYWTFAMDDALLIESAALKGTEALAFRSSEWRVECGPAHDTLGGNMVWAYNFIEDIHERYWPTTEAMR